MIRTFSLPLNMLRFGCRFPHIIYMKQTPSTNSLRLFFQTRVTMGDTFKFDVTPALKYNVTATAQEVHDQPFLYFQVNTSP
jgi:hypothetical protein